MGRQGLIGRVSCLVIASLLVSLAPAWADPAEVDPPGSSAPAESELTVPQDVSDAQSAPDEMTAGMIAAEFGHPVVVESSLSETEQVRAMPDGTSELTVESQPVRARSTGQWAPLDLSLQVVDGVLVPRNAAVPVELSAGGAGSLMRIQAEDGQWVSEGWTLGALPAPQVTGNRAEYRQVLPDVDLAVTVKPTGVSQVLVVKTAAAAADSRLEALRLSLAAPELSLRPNPASRTLSALDADGDAVLATASASWWDSSQADASADGPGMEGVLRPVPATVDGSGTTLQVSAVGETPGVTFPLYVDPDWTKSKDSYTFVDSAYPSSGYWNGGGAADVYAHVGSVSPYIGDGTDDGLFHTTRSFWNFSLAGLAGKNVLNATFNGQLYYSNSCANVPTELWLTNAAQSWTTWNSQPGWLSKQDSKNSVGGRSGCSGQPAVGFTVTNGVRTNLAGGWSSVAFGMRSSDESNYSGWRKYYSAANLTVSYNTPPPSPTGRSVTCAYVCLGDVVYTRSRTPVLTGQATDADGNTLRYEFQVFSGHWDHPTAVVASGSVSGVASGVKASWTVSTSLASNGNYEYQVRACDSVECGEWSEGWTRFTVDDVAPAPPSLSATGPVSTDPNSFSGTVGSSIETVTIHPATNDRAYAYIYRMAPRGAAVSFPSNLTCGQTSGGYTMKCLSPINADATVTVVPPTVVSSLTVWTVDAAGNTQSNPARIDFFAMDSNEPVKGHQWRTDSTPGSGVCPSTASSVPDVTASGVTAANLAAGGACWRSETVLAAQGSSWTLEYGGDDASTTPGPLLDTTGSFSVAAWVKPTAVGGYQTFLSQDGSTRSAFYLQMDSTSFRFCVTPSQAASAVCALGPAVTENQWTFVAGVWNAQTKIGSLYVSTTGQVPSTPDATVVAASQLDQTSGPVAVGRALSSGAPTNYFTGQVLHPTVMPGAASYGQLTQIGYVFTAPKDLA